MSACFLGLSALGNDENVTRIIARSPNRHRRVDGGLPVCAPPGCIRADRGWPDGRFVYGPTAGPLVARAESEDQTCAPTLPRWAAAMASTGIGGPPTPIDECAIATTDVAGFTPTVPHHGRAYLTWLIAPLLDPQLHPWTVVRLGVLRLRTPSRDAPAHHRRPLGSAARRHLRAVLRPPAHHVAGAAPRPRRRSGRRSRLDPPSRTRRRADVVRRHGAGRVDSPGRAPLGVPSHPRPPLLSRFAARVPMISVAGRATRVLDAGDGPALACSPGIASFVWDWAPVAQCLSATHRVIVVERPADERLGTGHLDAERLDVEHPGAAARPDAAHPDLERADADQPEATAGAPTMLEDDAAHLLNALDALGVTGPVTFVGHSGLSWRKPRRAWPRSGPRPSSCSTGHSPRTAPPSPRRLDRADAHDSWWRPCEAARPSLPGGSAAPRFSR